MFYECVHACVCVCVSNSRNTRIVVKERQLCIYIYIYSFAMEYGGEWKLDKFPSCRQEFLSVYFRRK